MRYRVTVERVLGYSKTRQDVIIDCKNDGLARRVVDALVKTDLLAAVVSVKLEEDEHV